MNDEAGLPFVDAMLETEIDRLETEIQDCSVLDSKARMIGELNQVRFAKKLLKKCEDFGVLPSSTFLAVPNTISSFSEWRIMEDVETEDRGHWNELKTSDDRHFRLYGGDVAIKV